jgi:hypothetical protein
MSGRSSKILASALVLGAAGAIAFAGKMAKPKPEQSVPADQVKWEKPFGEQGPGFATIWGDRAKGEHGTFLKIAAGSPADLHTHPGDTWGVVITGEMTHVTDGHEGAKLTAGGWWFMPGKVVHKSICHPGPADCLIFIHNKGPFGYAPAQDKMAPAPTK